MNADSMMASYQGSLGGITGSTDSPAVKSEKVMKSLFQAIADEADSGEVIVEGEKFKITPEGGYAIRLTNRTGAISVKGTVVTMSGLYDDAFALQTVEFDGVGICYESGVVDGAECWVVVSGIAEVLLKDGTGSTRGSWVKCADTDGRAEATTPPTNIGALAASEHFKEIGHCIQTVIAGINQLARVVLHFN